MNLWPAFEIEYDAEQRGWWVRHVEHPEARRFWGDEQLKPPKPMSWSAWREVTDWCDEVEAYLSGAVVLTSEPHRSSDTSEV
jgi:hypothetical protein